MKINFQSISPEIMETETEYGEPQGWLYLKNGRSIEITHEEYCVPEREQFFSVRLNCSDEEFENDSYHSTMGIIEVVCTSTIEEVKSIVEKWKEREEK